MRSFTNFFSRNQKNTKQYELSVYQLRFETACQFAKAIGYSQDDIVNIMMTNADKNKEIRNKIMRIATNILLQQQIISISTLSKQNPEEAGLFPQNYPKDTMDFVSIKSIHNVDKLWNAIRTEAENIRGQAALESKTFVGKVISFFLPRTEYQGLRQTNRSIILSQSLDIANNHYDQWKRYLNKTLIDKPNILTRNFREIWNPAHSSSSNTFISVAIAATAIHPLLALFIYQEQIIDALNPVFKLIRTTGKGLFNSCSWSLQGISLLPFAVFEIFAIPQAAIQNMRNEWVKPAYQNQSFFNRMKASLISLKTGMEDQIQSCTNNNPMNQRLWGSYLFQAKNNVAAMLNMSKPLTMLGGVFILSIATPIAFSFITSGLFSLGLGSIMTPLVYEVVKSSAIMLFNVAFASSTAALVVSVLPTIIKKLGEAISFIPLGIFETMCLPANTLIGMCKGFINGNGISGKITGLFTGIIAEIADHIESSSNARHPHRSIIGGSLHNRGKIMSQNIDNFIDGICNKVTSFFSDGYDEKEKWMKKFYPTQKNINKVGEDLKMTENEMRTVIGKMAGHVVGPDRYYANNPDKVSKVNAINRVYQSTAAQDQGGAGQSLFIENIVNASRAHNDNPNANNGKFPINERIFANRNENIIARNRN